MPIKIPNNLPATETLNEEHIFVMTETRAISQDIRPLKIGIVNLMPTKIATETQLLRCLSNTPLQIEVDLIHTKSYIGKNTAESHLEDFYCTFEDIKDEFYDGLIITGAPVENMPFEEVDYWAELCSIMEWSKNHVHSTLHICWASQAALYYHYGINKHQRNEKLSGVYLHKALTPKSRLFRGFDNEYYAPHSRHTEVWASEIDAVPELKIMAMSDIAGVHVVGDQEGTQFFVSGHSEYDLTTLQWEYDRDVAAGENPPVPVNYFEDNDPQKSPINRWKAHGTLMFTNWLNYYVYQTTPFEIKGIKDHIDTRE